MKKDLREQLEKMHKGTELYSPVLGKVKLIHPSLEERNKYWIMVEKNGSYYEFMPDGSLYDYEDAEQMLFIPEQESLDKGNKSIMVDGKCYYCECLNTRDYWDVWLFNYCENGKGNITSNYGSICCGDGSASKPLKNWKFEECDYFLSNGSMITDNEDFEVGEARNLREATPEEIEFMKNYLETKGLRYSEAFKGFISYLN